MNNAPANPSYLGAFFAITAFSLWGVFPIYFKSVSALPPFEVLSHRVLWSVVLLAILLVLTRRTNEIIIVFCNRKLLGLLTLSALLITLNWLVFIWAVSNNMVLQSSLGYFINPLVSVALGVVFLKERLRRWQMVAVLTALVGVGNLIFQSGSQPWIALTMAVSFGLYGLVRKVAEVRATVGLFVETLIVLPVALAYLIYVDVEGTGTFMRVSLNMDALLAFAGLMTATPLVLFALAAKRMRLGSLGF
ncbi:MAG TPA: EamA family transporter RarD, partial [Rhodospirillales bacterium]|nr:EamA family transporter RarD [Rhodospirillales bacterium]